VLGKENLHLPMSSTATTCIFLPLSAASNKPRTMVKPKPLVLGKF
jgi:hypothetical protein